AHQRKRQRLLLLWAGAGGLALCLGWAVGTAFRPSESVAEQPPGAPNQPESVQVGPVQTQPGSEATGSEPLAEPAPEQSAPAEQPASTVGLADLPGDDEAEKSPGDSSDETDAFTLDDLPLD